MKRMKKILAVLLAAIMVMSLGTSALADTTYSITVPDSLTGGSVSVEDSATTAAANSTVTLTVSPNTGYSTGTVTYTYGNTTKKATVDSTDKTKYTFTMPSADVTVNATFTANNYNITNNTGESSASSNHGYVIVAESADYSDTVSITLVPNIGYEVKSVTVTQTDSDDSLIEATKDENNGNLYTFAMPASAVTVSAKFEKTNYTISGMVTPSASNGSISVTVENSDNSTTLSNSATATADYENSVSVTAVTSKDGYRLASLVVTQADGTDVMVTETQTSGTYTFRMPASDVKITAVFSETNGSDNKTYTITIKNDKSGHTYEAYQIFTGDLSENSDGNLVLSNIKWGTGVDSSSLVTALTEASEYDNSALYGLFPSKDADEEEISWTAAMVAAVVDSFESDSDAAKEFAQIVSENLSDDATTSSTESSSPYIIAALVAGYYLVIDESDSLSSSKGDAYTDAILQVVGDVTVNEKSDYPTVEKTVDGSTSNSANIGETVEYTLTATLPDISAYTEGYQLTFNDTMSKGLTYDSTAGVTVTVYTDSSDTTGTVVASTSGGYEASSSTDATSGETTLTVEIKNVNELYATESTTAISVEEETRIVVIYQAKVNDNAVIGGSGNTNSVNLTYSNDPNWSGTGTEPTGTTTTAEVVTWTFELDVTKVDGEDNDTKLEGAKFVLYRMNDSDEEEYLVLSTTSTNQNEVSSWTKMEALASTLSSGTSGTFSIVGLEEGTYYLKETEAPEGYNLLSDPIKIVISATYSDSDGDGYEDAIETLAATADGKSLTTATETGKISLTVENNAGSTLPTTGGIGTTIFYVVGAVLVVGAAVILITRRRMANR